MDDKKYLGEHAVVIGNSVVGMCTSRVLSKYFRNVTVIERDIATDKERPGVPQGWQVHTLLPTGADIFKSYFPKFEETLLKNGSYPYDYCGDVRYYIRGWKPRVPTGKITYTQSRLMFENSVRSLLHEIPNITFLYECEARGLLTNFQERRITGVRIFNKQTQKEQNIYGDLIVDAGGRHGHVPEWLESLGYERPKRTEVQIELSYLNRIFRFPENYQPDWKVMLIMDIAPTKKKGGIVRIENDTEGNRWMINLVGQFGQNPTPTDEGFLKFAKELVQPDIYEAIKVGTPISPFLPFKFPAVWRNHYEKIKSPPSGFIAIGDAVCAFSPVYGLGMTAGAMMTKTLDAVLAENHPDYLENLRKNYFQHVKKFIDRAWALNVNQEFLMPETKGKRPMGIHAFNQYKKAVLEICNTDVELWKTMLSIIYLEKTLKSLFKPSIFVRVWRKLRTMKK